MTLSARKRRRDDAASELQRQRASNSSPLPPPDYDQESDDMQGMALEEFLEKVATGQGEDTGATLQSPAAIALRMIKVLRKKQETERGLAAMQMSRMQAAHSSEKRETAERLRLREEENLALRLELETLRAQVLLEQEQDNSAVTMAGMLVDCRKRPQTADIETTKTTTWPEKHRLEMLELVDAEAHQPLLKRGKTANSHRREKINERLKYLQNLVPNGAKVDIVTMLDETFHYVKFLQSQVELLKSDDYWMYATPNNYNGMDLSKLSPELESSA